MRHSLKNLDREALTADCAVCGPVLVSKRNRGGGRGPRYQCVVKRRSEQSGATPEARARRIDQATARLKPWRALLDPKAGDACNRCGFIAEDRCQLDVDHVVPRSRGGADDPGNLQILCANCHRLKSKLERTGGRKRMAIRNS